MSSGKFRVKVEIPSSRLQLPASRRKIKFLIRRLADIMFNRWHEKLDGWTVYIYLIGERRFRKIRWRYIQDDHSSDVVALNYEAESFIKGSSERLLGEVYVCIPAVYRNCKRYSNSVLDELMFVIAHGMLHLLGYEDDTPQKRQQMFELQWELLNELKREGFGYEN